MLKQGLRSSKPKRDYFDKPCQQPECKLISLAFDKCMLPFLAARSCAGRTLAPIAKITIVASFEAYRHCPKQLTHWRLACRPGCTPFSRLWTEPPWWPLQLCVRMHTAMTPSCLTCGDPLVCGATACADAARSTRFQPKIEADFQICVFSLRRHWISVRWQHLSE